MKIRPVEAELRTDGQTDTRTDMTKLKVAFCNYANASKKLYVADCFLGLRVRIPPSAWASVSCECCVCFQVEVSAMGRFFIQRSPTDCGVPY